MIERVLLMGGAGCDAEAIAARLKISVATVRRIADAWATERDARDG
jgi:DNA-binding NarL/FixJ family response regulator